MKIATLVLAGAAMTLASAASAAPAGDAAHGEQLFVRCATCHTINARGANRIGPNLHGLFSRPVAHAPGFSYTAALKAQSFIWDDGRLDRWLTDPRAMVPGTAMILRNPSAADRRDLIAYLKKAAR
jgi:cytochrome c